MEEEVMKGMQMLCAAAWTQMRNISKATWQLSTKPTPLLPAQPTGTPVLSLEGSCHSHCPQLRQTVLSVRALSCARQVALLTFPQGLGYLQDVSLHYSKEGNSRLISLRNNECKGFQKRTDTEMSAAFSLKGTPCQLCPCSGSCDMGTLHCTAQQRQHRPLEQGKRFRV